MLPFIICTRMAPGRLGSLNGTVTASPLWGLAGSATAAKAAAKTMGSACLVTGVPLSGVL
jgi:hypothetical protein